MDTKWNDDEDERLQGLPLMAQVLYLRGLRRHMDYGTGLVGVTRKVSYQMFKELLSVDRRIGSTLRDDEVVSIKQIRVALSQLEAAGLICRRPKSKRTDPMVFRLPLASLGAVFVDDPGSTAEIRPAEEGQRKGKGGGAEDGQSENVVFMPVAGTYPHRGGAEEGQRRKGIPPDLRKETHTDARARVDSLKCKTAPVPVPDDFAVTEQHVEYARAHRLPDPHECLLAFVAHHQARGTLRENWDAEFRKWLANERVYRQGRTRHAQAGTSSTDPSPSTAKRPGGSHAPHQLRRQSGAEIIARGCEDALEEFSPEDE